MLLTSTIPVLPSLDLDETIVYYQRLGFSLLSRHDDDYAILARDGHELHFFVKGDLNPAESFFSTYWRTANAEALYEEYAALGLSGLHPPEEKPWGMFEFAVVDPHGNLHRIGQEIE